MVNLEWIKRIVKEDEYLKMGKNRKEIGKIIKQMVLEFIKVKMSLMKENGKMIDKKELELKVGKMELHILENLKMDKNVEKENLKMLMEVIILEVF